MKGKTIEKSNNIELELNEESMQLATGGCQTCIDDLNRSKRAQAVANSLINLAEATRNAGNVVDAGKYLNMADGHLRGSRAALNAVVERGHFPLDLNKPAVHPV